MGRDVRKFGGCLGTPHLEYLPRNVDVPLPLVGSKELGGRLGRDDPSGEDRRGEARVLEL